MLRFPIYVLSRPVIEIIIFSIDPNLRSIVYCTAIREGSETEWDFAYRKYLETSSVAEKNTLIDALGCTRQRWLLSRYMQKFLNTLFI